MQSYTVFQNVNRDTYQSEEKAAAHTTEEGANALHSSAKVILSGKGHGSSKCGNTRSSQGRKAFFLLLLQGQVGGEGTYHASPQRQKVSFPAHVDREFDEAFCAWLATE